MPDIGQTIIFWKEELSFVEITILADLFSTTLILTTKELKKCRVDLETAATRISNIILDVIIPPEKPRNHDENKEEV